MIRPTRRAVLIFAAGIPLSLFIVIYDASLWPVSFNYGVLALFAVSVDALLAFPSRRLTLRVDMPEKLYIGERGAALVTIPAVARRRATPLELLSEQRGELDPPEIVAVEVEPGREARVDLPLVPRRRGRVGIDRIWARWRGPMSLVELVKTFSVDRSIDVVPNVRGVQNAALQFFAHEAIFGVKVQQQRGEGAEFDSLREYAPGLDNRFIDWKHSARHHKLLCKEFKTERNHQVILGFDTGYLMSEPIDGIPRLDHAINAGLLLAWISLQGGDLVGSYGFDAAVRHYQTPMRGISSFARIQRATSELAYHHQETNFTLGLAELSARLRRRALVVLFTDFVDTVTAELLIESMQRVVNRHVVVFVTLRDSLLQRTVDAAPTSFESVAEAVIADDLLRDRSIVFERLERLGVHCLDVPSHGLSVGLLNRYLRIKQRGLL
ncbi:MAG TPA: DUF58 domain-containing protein [Stellaceae bacterium]|jgi:uncharacterized protein (DUF58 family)|nr:DUF58 domain-containing protein [Stellaceae bacterium]